MRTKPYTHTAEAGLASRRPLKLAAPPRLVRAPHGLGQPDCPICLGRGYLSRDVPVGHPDFGRAYPCACRRAEIDRSRASLLPRLANLLPHELEFRLEQLAQRGEATQAMIRAAADFQRAPYGLMTLWGPPGNGKSFVLKSMVNHFNDLRFGHACYARLTDLLDLLQASPRFEAGSEPAEWLARLKTIWFLALDDVDTAALADSGGEFQARFFDQRYRLAREGAAHTALALNHDPGRLPGSIFDRLSWGSHQPGGFRIVQNGDPSARPEGL